MNEFIEYKLAVKTRAAWLKERDMTLAAIGRTPEQGDSSSIVHDFGDGWTIRKLETDGDHQYEGALMRNCIKGYHPGSGIHSLRDADNIPHCSFTLYAKHPPVIIQAMYARANTRPKPEHIDRITPFLKELSGGKSIKWPFSVQDYNPLERRERDEWDVNEDPNAPEPEPAVPVVAPRPRRPGQQPQPQVPNEAEMRQEAERMRGMGEEELRAHIQENAPEGFPQEAQDMVRDHILNGGDPAQPPAGIQEVLQRHNWQPPANMRPRRGNLSEEGKLALRLAVKTRATWIKERDLIAGQIGGDKSKIVHKYDDGWSIRALQTAGDHFYEGTLMRNCIKARGSGRPHDQAYPSGIHSLRDPDNIPHVSFTVHDTEDLINIPELFARANTRPKPEQIMKIEPWVMSISTAKGKKLNINHNQQYHDDQLREREEWGQQPQIEMLNEEQLRQHLMENRPPNVPDEEVERIVQHVLQNGGVPPVQMGRPPRRRGTKDALTCVDCWGDGIDNEGNTCQRCGGMGYSVFNDEDNWEKNSSIDAFQFAHNDWCVHDDEELLIEKTAANTKAWYLRKRDKLRRLFGPGNEEVVHDFRDGWTVKRMRTRVDNLYEGLMAEHCGKWLATSGSGIGVSTCFRCLNSDRDPNPHCMYCGGTGLSRGGEGAQRTKFINNIPPCSGYPSNEGDHRAIMSLRDPDDIPQAMWQHPFIDARAKAADSPFDIHQVKQLTGRGSSDIKPEHKIRVLQYLQAKALPHVVIQEGGFGWDRNFDENGLAEELNKTQRKMGKLTLAARLAVKTRAAWVKERDALLGQIGGKDYSTILHEFPDGWTIRKLHTIADHKYEGNLMRNCISGKAERGPCQTCLGAGQNYCPLGRECPARNRLLNDIKVCTLCGGAGYRGDNWIRCKNCNGRGYNRLEPKAPKPCKEKHGCKTCDNTGQSSWSTEADYGIHSLRNLDNIPQLSFTVAKMLRPYRSIIVPEMYARANTRPTAEHLERIQPWLTDVAKEEGFDRGVSYPAMPRYNENDERDE